jgi:CheY-like chemotaxis protein
MAARLPRVMMQTAGPILVVDDDADVLHAITELLEDAGYRVERADGGSSALALLRAGVRPAMMIVDYGMPEMSGLELLRACSRTAGLADIPAVLTTAYRDGELPDTAEIVLRKPFQADELLECVARMVGRR